MRTWVICLILFCIAHQSLTQIVIDQTDMPGGDDTLRVSITTAFTEEYSQAGPDQVWDFTGLTRMSQRVESFVDIMETPNLFWFTFVPNVVANLASPPEGMNAFPGPPFSDFYTFLKKTSPAFSDAGFGFLLSGIPISLKYNNPDIYYKLPCTEGDEWNSSSSAFFTLPGVAYFRTERTRHSVVDAWGTLKTPFGTFQTIRVKSEVSEYDSLYFDTLASGIPVVRNYTEYKWLGKGQGIPLLQITEEAMTRSAVYRDHAAPMTLRNADGTKTRIFPNPSENFCTIDLTGIHFPAVLRITSIKGSTVHEQSINPAMNKTCRIDLPDLPAGCYFLLIRDPEKILSEKIIIMK